MSRDSPLGLFRYGKACLVAFYSKEDENGLCLIVFWAKPVRAFAEPYIYVSPLDPPIQALETAGLDCVIMVSYCIRGLFLILLLPLVYSIEALIAAY